MESYFTSDNSKSIVMNKETDKRFNNMSGSLKADFKDKPNWINKMQYSS